MANAITLDSSSILAILPHRFPFLFIDRVLHLIPNDSIVALKNVSINEPFFQGHFPNLPVMPGVLLLEAMAQAVCVLSTYSHTDDHNINTTASTTHYVLSKIDKAVFKETVTPGEQLIIKAKYQWKRGAFVRCQAHTLVNEQVVCAAEITGVQQTPPPQARS